MKLIKLLPLFLLLAFAPLRAQDLHLSQYNEIPSLINPALTGVHGLRASLHYRSQWKKVTTPYKTQGLSFENRTVRKKKKAPSFESKNERDKPKSFLGYGVSLFHDKSGDGKAILNQVNMSVAGFVPTGLKSFLSLGLQASYARRKMKEPSFIYPNQYAEGGYDTNINSGEDITGDRFGYLDFAAGLQWTYNSESRGLKEERDLKGHFGVAIYHLTQPKQKFMVKSKEVLPFKYVAHADMLFRIKQSRVATQPSAIFQMQGSSMEITGGALVKYYLNNNTTRYTNYVKQSSVSAGLYYRTSDAIIFQGLLEWQERFAVGLSYDFNISPLRQASRLRGGTELMLRFTPGFNESHYEKLEKGK